MTWSRLTFYDGEEYYGGEDWSGILVQALPEDVDLVLACGLPWQQVISYANDARYLHSGFNSPVQGQRVRPPGR